MDVILWNTSPDLPKFGNNIVLFRTIGAYKIAHSVRNAGYTAQVIDYVISMTADELYACTVKFITPDTVCFGISTTWLMSDNHGSIPPSIIEVLNRISLEYPNIKITFGGARAKRVESSASAFAKLNAAFIHYSEDTFLEYIKFLKKDGNLPPFQMEVWKDKNVYVFNKPAEEKFNIECDNFRFTDQDHIMQGETLPLEISRGCIFKCKFCNHLMLGRGKLDYLRDFELIKEELIHNYEKWGVTNYYIICDTFNDTEFKMKAWHAMVTSLPFKINYISYLRADLLDRYPDVPYMLQESGLIASWHGIETLGEKASMLIGKGWSGKSARTFIPKLTHDIWKGKVKQTMSFIAGFPGDTKESLMDTARWVVDNDLHHIKWFPLGMVKASRVLNFSEFERNSEQYGFRFPHATIPPGPGNIQWETDYWNYDQVLEYVDKTLIPFNINNPPYGAWGLLYLMQYGVTKEWFEKDKQPYIGKEFNIKKTSEDWLKAYIAKLMGQ